MQFRRSTARIGGGPSATRSWAMRLQPDHRQRQHRSRPTRIAPARPLPRHPDREGPLPQPPR
eukprot:2525240-Alexandrium_andersonii.AAC.1